LPVVGSKDGGRVYTGRHPGSKMEIPVKEDWRTMKLRGAVLLALTLGCLIGHSRPCEVVSNIPAGNPKMGGALITADRPSQRVVINGGQSVYVRVTNANAVGGILNLSITTGSLERCSVNEPILPKTSVIYRAAGVFDELPITWAIVGSSDSDAATLTLDVFSQLESKVIVHSQISGAVSVRLNNGPNVTLAGGGTLSLDLTSGKNVLSLWSCGWPAPACRWLPYDVQSAETWLVVASSPPPRIILRK